MSILYRTRLDMHYLESSLGSLLGTSVTRGAQEGVSDTIDTNVASPIEMVKYHHKRGQGNKLTIPRSFQSRK